MSKAYQTQKKWWKWYEFEWANTCLHYTFTLYVFATYTKIICKLNVYIQCKDQPDLYIEGLEELQDDDEPILQLFKGVTQHPDEQETLF